MRISFAEFVFDRKARLLLCGEEKLHLEPKAFELLDLLLARRPEAVSKSEIQTQLWPDTFVSEGNVTGLVRQIRQALQDDRTRSRFIRTVHGFGYAFAGETNPHEPSPERAQHSGYCVVWDQRVRPLESGENILGRADGVAVQIDAQGVSRHHARIVIRADETLLEDMGSKNGTHFQERRLEGPVPLRDGDVFRLGSQTLTFRRTPVAGSTATEPVR
jgi:DNA-binding winged helix-turn-helix (wHTH) protein